MARQDHTLTADRPSSARAAVRGEPRLPVSRRIEMGPSPQDIRAANRCGRRDLKSARPSRRPALIEPSERSRHGRTCRPSSFAGGSSWSAPKSLHVGESVHHDGRTPSRFRFATNSGLRALLPGSKPDPWSAAHRAGGDVSIEGAEATPVQSIPSALDPNLPSRGIGPMRLPVHRVPLHRSGSARAPLHQAFPP